MSGLDLYNTLQLRDVRKDAQGSSQIMELGQRADYIQRSTGSRPESWYEFKKKNAEELNLSPVKKALIGAVIGVTIGASVLFGVAAIAGMELTAFTMGHMGLMALGFGVTGAIFGQNMEVERENLANKKLISGYDSYLSGFEQAHLRGNGARSSIDDDVKKPYVPSVKPEAGRVR